MRVLVTGGADFIGGHLAERFLSDGHSVTVLYSMHPYYDCRIKEHTLAKHSSVAEARGSAYAFVGGTLNIHKTARETDIERVVVATSSSVYGGRGDYMPFDETDSTTGGMKLTPTGFNVAAVVPRTG